MTKTGIPKPRTVTINVGGQNFEVAADYEANFRGLLNDLYGHHYTLAGPGAGGYNDRGIVIMGKESKTPSRHASGAAIDIAPQLNAQGTRGAIDPVYARQVAAKWGLKWGGDFKTPDPMHFEVPKGGAVAKNSGTGMDYTSIYSLLKRNGATDQEAKTLTAIALAESQGDPKAVGDKKLQNATYGPSVGLFQIRTTWEDKGKGRTRDQDALSRSLDKQAQSALEIARSKRGYNNWTTYTSGKYAQYDNPRAGAPGSFNPVDVGGTLPGAPTLGAYPTRPSAQLGDYGPAPVMPKPYEAYYEDPVTQQQRLNNAFGLPTAEVEAIQKRILAENAALAAQQQAEYQRQADLERGRLGASQQFVNQGLSGIGDVTAAATLANQAGSAAAAQSAIANLAQASGKGMEAFFPGGAQGAANSIGQILQANVGQGLLNQMGQSQLAQAQRQYETNQQFGLEDAQARYARQDQLLRGAQGAESDKAQAINQARKDAYQGGLTGFEQASQDRRSGLSAAVDLYGTDSSNVSASNKDKLAVWGQNLTNHWNQIDADLQNQADSLRAQEIQLNAEGKTKEAKQAQWEVERLDAARTWKQGLQSAVGFTSSPDGNIDPMTIGNNYDPTASGNAAKFFDKNGNWAGFDFAGAKEFPPLSDGDTGNLMISLAIANRVDHKPVSSSMIREIAEVRVLGQHAGEESAPKKGEKKGEPVIAPSGHLNISHPGAAVIRTEIDNEAKRLEGIYKDLTVAPNEDMDAVLDAVLGQANQNKATIGKGQLMVQNAYDAAMRLPRTLAGAEYPMSNDERIKALATAAAVGQGLVTLGPLAPAALATGAVAAKAGPAAAKAGAKAVRGGVRTARKVARKVGIG